MSFISFFNKTFDDKIDDHIWLGIETHDDNPTWKNHVDVYISNAYSATCDRVLLTNEERLALIEFLQTK